MKNISDWKTTILGIILIISGLGYTGGCVFYKSDVNYIVMSILIASGIGMIFSPDTIISKLNYLIDKKSKEV